MSVATAVAVEARRDGLAFRVGESVLHVIPVVDDIELAEGPARGPRLCRGRAGPDTVQCSGVRQKH